MKKLVVLLFSIFFLNFTVSAETINSVSVSLNFADANVANIIEDWSGVQNNKVLKKQLADVQHQITDLTVKSNDVIYKKVKSCKNLKINTYSFNDNFICVKVGKVESVSLNYNLKGLVHKYNDSIGMEWRYLDNNKSLQINSLNIYINNKDTFNKVNTALYAIGNNVEANIVDGKIHITAKNIKRNRRVILMSTFNDMTFNEYVVENRKFKEVYNEVLKETSLTTHMFKILKNRITAIIIIIVGIILVVIGVHYIRYINSKDKLHVISKKNIKSMDEVKYYENIPCRNNFELIYFLGNHFEIIKNKSDYIGALILKWIYDGYLEIDGKKQALKVINDKVPFKDGELELFKIFMDVASKNKIDKTNTKLYIKDNYIVFYNWFNNITKRQITDLLKKNKVKKQKKFGIDTYILADTLTNDANNIEGAKKYLMNFNQVPRSSELTIEEYKNLLILANILGIGKNVASEIIRKNPDNLMAKQLLDLNNIKDIYSNIFEDSKKYYSQKLLKHKKSNHK